MRYYIGVYDRAGEYMSASRDTLPEALAVARELAARYPDKILQASSDNADCSWEGEETGYIGTNGLSEDEEAAFGEAIYHGRRETA